MKKITFIGFGILLAFNGLLTYWFFFKTPIVAYVDSNVLLENYEGMKAARQRFQQKATQWQANIDTLKAELDREIRNFEQKKKGATKRERELSEELIQTKRQQFMNYQQAIQQQSQQEDLNMTQEVLNEVNAFIGSYGKKNGYTLILGATTMGNIIYAEEVLDITDELQEALNDQYLGLN